MFHILIDNDNSNNNGNDTISGATTHEDNMAEGRIGLGTFVDYSGTALNNVYGIDFDKEIAAAVGRGDYREAVRLRYLQCLKFLSDHEVIDWRIYKTPAQYTREYKQAAFTQLTRTYVLVRYGDRDANQSVLDGIVSNYESIVERVKDSKVAAAGQEEGGPA